MSEFEMENTDCLLSSPVNFLDDQNSTSPIVISSRVRLARNIKGMPFPPAGDICSASEVAAMVKEAVDLCKVLGDEYWSFTPSSLSMADRLVLLERRLASSELLQSVEAHLHVSRDSRKAIMVNEEDHLRLQVVMPGLQLKKCWEDINVIDDALSSKLDMAYDGTLGYLTACPSNVGTALRVSAMLHLPAMNMEKSIVQLERALAKLGLTVRGISGEGSEGLGNLYQISNQSTLGEGETEIISQLGRVIDQVIEHEESLRAKLMEHRRNNLLDVVGRSYGLLRYSYLLTSREAYNALSMVRLGVDLGLFNSLDIQIVNELFVAVGTGHLQKLAMRELSEREQNAFRAQIVRERLKKNSPL